MVAGRAWYLEGCSGWWGAVAGGSWWSMVAGGVQELVEYASW